MLSIAHMAKEGYKRTMLRITVVYEWLLIEAKKRDQYSFLCTMMKYLRFLFTYISNYFCRRLLIFIGTARATSKTRSVAPVPSFREKWSLLVLKLNFDFSLDWVHRFEQMIVLNDGICKPDFVSKDGANRSRIRGETKVRRAPSVSKWVTK